MLKYKVSYDFFHAGSQTGQLVFVQIYTRQL